MYNFPWKKPYPNLLLNAVFGAISKAGKDPTNVDVFLLYTLYIKCYHNMTKYEVAENVILQCWKDSFTVQSILDHCNLFVCCLWAGSLSM